MWELSYRFAVENCWHFWGPLSFVFSIFAVLLTLLEIVIALELNKNNWVQKYPIVVSRCKFISKRDLSPFYYYFWKVGYTASLEREEQGKKLSRERLEKQMLISIIGFEKCDFWEECCWIRWPFRKSLLPHITTSDSSNIAASHRKLIDSLWSAPKLDVRFAVAQGLGFEDFKKDL